MKSLLCAGMQGVCRGPKCGTAAHTPQCRPCRTRETPHQEHDSAASSPVFSTSGRIPTPNAISDNSAGLQQQQDRCRRSRHLRVSRVAAICHSLMECKNIHGPNSNNTLHHAQGVSADEGGAAEHQVCPRKGSRKGNCGDHQQALRRHSSFRGENLLNPDLRERCQWSSKGLNIRQQMSQFLVDAQCRPAYGLACGCWQSQIRCGQTTR